MDTVEIKSSSDLENVTKQFENWRACRKRHERIPEHLWQAAVTLCKSHPTTHVCRCLRLSYADLKKHLITDEKSNHPVEFVQIDMAGVAGNWQLCCQRADGAKLSLTVNGPVPAIEHLLQKFLS